MRITTDAIDRDGMFDPRYTGDLDNSSPEIRWEDVPPEARSFALIMEDPDATGEDPDLPAGSFTHWLIYDIPESIHHLPAGIPPQEALPNGIRQGTNSFGKLGYGGPLPPIRDGTHRYIIKLYALHLRPELPTRLTRAGLLQAIEPHVLATAELMGRYQRLNHHTARKAS